MDKNLKGIDLALLNQINDLNSFLRKLRPRGGMVTQRIANPFIPVRFWTWPPRNWLFYFLKKVCSSLFLGSSVGRAVDC